MARGLGRRRIEAVERRGKYLLIELDGGRTLAIHLRMTGNLLLRAPDAEGQVADLMEIDRRSAARGSTRPRSEPRVSCS